LKFPQHIVPELFKEGYITKRGDSVKTWKKRWFVLKGKIIKYYISKEDAREQPHFPQGTIAGIKRCVLVSIDRENSFIIHTDKRQFYCCADTDQEMREWMNNINEIVNQTKFAPPSSASIPHAWAKAQNFDKPLRCLQCTSFIWGANGFHCKACECGVHKHCMKELADNCKGFPKQ